LAGRDEGGFSGGAMVFIQAISLVILSCNTKSKRFYFYYDTTEEEQGAIKTGR
jgi:hypothetical protein